MQKYISDEFGEQAIKVLDVGCGEGYYSSNLTDSNLAIYGVDISKSAVTLAAKVYSQLKLAVASSFKLPYLDQSFDFVFCIFSPYSISEIARVLKPGGEFMIVDPNPNHLAGFSEAVLGKFKPHAGNHSQLTESTELLLVSETGINFKIALENSVDIQNLLTMTPYFWRVNAEQRAIVDSLNQLKTSIDFGVHILKKI